MATKKEKLNAIHWYKQETGKTEIDMHEVASWLVAKGWPLPAPADPLDRLAHDLSRVAREEIRHDVTTGRPYRVNHAMLITQGSQQLTLWIDIDEQTTTRPKMLKCLVKRREGMVDDGLQLSFDQEHWNRIHPTEEPINLPLDLTDDVEWRKNVPDDEEDQEAG